ncbi:MAG: glycosyltransferase [Alphaproteobacteria bacterium]|nr:glycosyltransferase [Alphaproteobacteria bacterium]MCB9795974.1 glycosyltransferase [Alphaproteobacteria bacterium]
MSPLLQGLSAPARQRPLAVVVPAFVRGAEDAANLRLCLEALLCCDPGPAELIVVDDGSPEPVPSVGLSPRIRVLRQENAGPAAARNAGARASSAPLLVFVDADVVVPPDALGRLAALLEDADAAWGTVLSAHPHPGLVSRYKNLTHRHFTLQLGPGDRPHPTSHLTTMLAGLRREAFEAVGGFDEALSTVSVEDVELGRALAEAGFTVLLDPSLAVEHRHRFTLGGAVRNDAHKLRRLVSTTLRRRGEGQRSVAAEAPDRERTRRYLLSIPLGVGAVAFTLSGRPARGALCLAGLALAERDLLRFLAEAEDPRFAARCLPLMALERVTASAAIAAGAWDHLRRG